MTTIKEVGSLRYYPEKIIGEGSFGTVYEGIFHNIFNGISQRQDKIVAVKRILKRHDADGSAILREVEVMEKAIHPNILQVIAVEKNDDFL